MIDLKEIYYRAFSSRGTGCSQICECGRVTFDGFGDWDWEEGELEGLRADPQAIEVDYSVPTYYINGKTYVQDCPCEGGGYLKKQIAGIENNLQELADYINFRREAMVAYVESLPKAELEDPRFRYELNCNGCPHRKWSEGDHCETPPGWGSFYCDKLNRGILEGMAKGKGRLDDCPLTEPKTVIGGKE